MRDFLVQIKKGLDVNLYLLSLFSALAIPDICGAMGSENGEASTKSIKHGLINILPRDTIIF